MISVGTPNGLYGLVPETVREIGRKFGLTPEEALAGMTRAGAQALGLADEAGTISAGKAADLCVWRIGRPAELCYWIGMQGPERRIVAGEDA